MSDLLTRDAYAAIAADLSLPSEAFIDGAFRPARSGRTFATFNPATGETLTDIAACDAADVDDAVRCAQAAFDDGRWRKLHPSERKNVLLEFARLAEEHRDELAVMESLD